MDTLAQASARRPSANLQIVLLTVIVLLVSLLVCDLIPVADHLGWDGNRYGKWVKELTLDSLPGGFNSYEVNRFLPSLVVRWTLLALHLELSNENIVTTFRIGNLLMAVIMVILWCRSADLIGIRPTGKWLGFIGLVINHATLKAGFFYPVLTDSFAMALGTACLFFYLSRRGSALLVTTLIGSFVWPTILPFGFLMLAFPRPVETPSQNPAWPAPWIAAAGAGATLVMIGWVVASGFRLRSTTVDLWLSFSYLSAAIVAIYLFFGVRHLTNSQAIWRDLRPTSLMKRRWLWIALLLPIIVGLIKWSLVSAPARINGKRIFFEILYTSITEPGIFLLAHVLYFGPIIILTVLLWPRVASSLISNGTGLALCCILALLIGAGSESRKWINFFPVIVLATTHAAQSLNWTRWRLALFAGLSLLLSKVWMPMAQDVSLPVVGEVSWRTLYSSSRGPWIDHDLYLGQAVVVAAVAGAIYYFTFHYKRNQTTDNPEP